MLTGGENWAKQAPAMLRQVQVVENHMLPDANRNGNRLKDSTVCDPIGPDLPCCSFARLLYSAAQFYWRRHREEIDAVTRLIWIDRNTGLV
jgi:hypothetical protein